MSTLIAHTVFGARPSPGMVSPWHVTRVAMACASRYLPSWPPSPSGRRLVAASAEGKGHARSVRSLPLVVVQVTRNPIKGAKGMADEYAGKIARYTEFVQETVRPNPGNVRSGEVQKQRDDEAARVMKLLQPRDLVVTLDERGKLVTSEDVRPAAAQPPLPPPAPRPPLPPPPPPPRPLFPNPRGKVLSFL